MRLACFSILIWLILFPPFSFARESFFRGDSASIYSIHDKRVRIERENVTIRYNPLAVKDPTLHAGERWLAECSYQLRNKVNRPLTVQMGMPDWHGFIDNGAPNGNAAWAIRNVSIKVNGKPIQPLHRDLKTAAGKKPPLLPGVGRLFYDGSYEWPVSFLPKGSVEVFVSYGFGGFSSTGPISQLVQSNESPFSLDVKDLFWNIKEIPSTDWDLSASAYETVAHLASTGLTWGGPIEEANIAIEVPPGILPHLLLPSPAGFSVEKGMVRWHFTHWKPKSELAIVQLHPVRVDGKSSAVEPFLFQTFAQAETWVRWVQRNRWEFGMLEKVKAAYQARKGFSFAEAHLATFFAGFPWYRSGPTVTPIALSEEEKKIISLLDSAAKELAGHPVQTSPATRAR